MCRAHQFVRALLEKAAANPDYLGMGYGRRLRVPARITCRHLGYIRIGRAAVARQEKSLGVGDLVFTAQGSPFPWYQPWYRIERNSADLRASDRV